MEIILLEKVANLGRLGQQVKVKNGYARNFLLPKGKAVSATVANIKKFEERRAELEKAEALVRGQAEARAKKLDGVVLQILVKAGEEGKLFGSVGIKDLVDAFAKQNIEVHKHEIHLPEGPLRQVGEHAVAMEFHSDVKFNVQVVLVAEEVAH